MYNKNIFWAVQSSKEFFNYLNPFLEEQTWHFTNWGHQKESFLFPALLQEMEMPPPPSFPGMTGKTRPQYESNFSQSRTFWMTLGHVFVSLGCIKFTLILVLLAWKWFVQEDYSVTQTVISNKEGPETAAIKIEHLLPPPPANFS